MVRIKRKANYATRPSKRYKKGYTRKRYRYGAKGSRKFKKMVKNTIIRMSEPKYTAFSLGQTQLYHNCGDSGGVLRPGNFFTLNQTAAMPTQGIGDSNRNGDRIYSKGFQVSLILGQKYDRPNVTFKIMVLEIPKGQSATVSTVFQNVTTNTLLDPLNMDFVKKVLYYKTYKPAKSTAFWANGGADTTREWTFPLKFWISRRMEYKFQADNGISHCDNDITMFISAYDAEGTLLSDNIAYVRAWTKFCFADP